MGIFKSIQNYFYNSSLNKHLKKKVEQSPTNFKLAKSIGILFDASDVDQQKIVLEYADTLRHKGKQVRLLGFFDDKNPREDVAFHHFNKKDINWYMLPKGTEVTNFLESNFDILLNLTLYHHKSFEYLTAAAKANLRVGPYGKDKTHCYDLMIDANQNNSLNNFIGQVDYFLKIVNKDE